jgi:hypothetical protein
MLTRQDVCLLHEAGLEIYIEDHADYDDVTPQGDIIPVKGFGELRDVESLEATLYKEALESNDDRDITLYHELVHERDLLGGYPIPSLPSKGEDHKEYYAYEDRVEEEALDTFRESPGLAAFIVEYFGIEDYPDIDDHLENLRRRVA